MYEKNKSLNDMCQTTITLENTYLGPYKHSTFITKCRCLQHFVSILFDQLCRGDTIRIVSQTHVREMRPVVYPSIALPRCAVAFQRAHNGAEVRFMEVRERESLASI